MIALFGIKIKAPAFLKAAATVLKPIKAVTAVIDKVPVVGQAALLVPGVAQVKVGVQVADSLVKAANSSNPAVKQKGLAAIAATKVLAGQAPSPPGKPAPQVSPAMRRAAANGLTLMKKRAAALRVARKTYKVETQGKNKGKIVRK